MGDVDKAVDVYLEEYKALRKEVELNLTAEGNAINWSILLVTGLLAAVASGNKLPNTEYARILLAVAPLMFTSLYMMLCKRHRNSRRISQYVVDHLSKQLAEHGVPSALHWDIRKLHPDNSTIEVQEAPLSNGAILWLEWLLAAAASIAVAIAISRVPTLRTTAWLVACNAVAAVCLTWLVIAMVSAGCNRQGKKAMSNSHAVRFWRTQLKVRVRLYGSFFRRLWRASLPPLMLAAFLLALWPWLSSRIAPAYTVPERLWLYIPSISALIAILAHISYTQPDEAWRIFANHSYRWLGTSLAPSMACTAALYSVRTFSISADDHLVITLLSLNALLSLRALMAALRVDFENGRSMKKAKQSVAIRSARRA